VNLRPNKPIQPTPLRSDNTVAILVSECSKNAFPVYHDGAADGQPVGPCALPHASLRLFL
jgi:hypothetical protein